MNWLCIILEVQLDLLTNAVKGIVFLMCLHSTP